MINAFILLTIDWFLIIEKAILISIIIAVSLIVAMYETWAERKVAAVIQDRRGPNRAGPFGILQPLADGLKLFMKEEIIPNLSNKFLFILGPGIAMLTAMMTSAVVPWGRHIHAFGRDVHLQIADVNIGILYIFGVVSMGVYGVMIGGWASNNKFSLLAAIRGASQIISYELAMGLATDCSADAHRFPESAARSWSSRWIINIMYFISPWAFLFSWSVLLRNVTVRPLICPKQKVN